MGFQLTGITVLELRREWFQPILSLKKSKMTYSKHVLRTNEKRPISENCEYPH